MRLFHEVPAVYLHHDRVDFRRAIAGPPDAGVVLFHYATDAMAELLKTYWLITKAR